MTPWKSATFRRLWIGRSLSTIGDAVSLVGLTFAVIAATGSATELGVVLAAQGIGQVGFILIGGVWADRLPRQRVMLIADAVRCLTHVAMAVEVLGGSLDISRLAVLAGVSGAASALFLPAATGIVPSTVESGHLSRANALLSFTTRGSQIAGPAIATPLALTVGSGWTLVGIAAAYAASATALAMLRVPTPPARPRESFGRQLAEGWRELRSHRWYWTNLIGHGGWNLARSVLFTLGPLIAVTSMGGEAAWGVIVQGGTIGGLAGGILALRLRSSRPLVTANLALALGAAPPILMALSAPVWVIAFAWGLASGGLALMSPLWETAVQHHIDPAALSRVSAYDWMLSLSLSPLGMALAGPLAGLIGPESTLYGAALIVAVPTVAVLALPDVRRLPTVPASSPDDRLAGAR